MAEPADPQAEHGHARRRAAGLIPGSTAVRREGASFPQPTMPNLAMTH
jgi:hypothetical protein